MNWLAALESLWNLLETLTLGPLQTKQIRSLLGGVTFWAGGSVIFVKLPSYVWHAVAFGSYCSVPLCYWSSLNIQRRKWTECVRRPCLCTPRVGCLLASRDPWGPALLLPERMPFALATSIRVAHCLCTAMWMRGPCSPNPPHLCFSWRLGKQGQHLQDPEREGASQMLPAGTSHASPYPSLADSSIWYWPFSITRQSDSRNPSYSPWPEERDRDLSKGCLACMCVQPLIHVWLFAIPWTIGLCPRDSPDKNTGVDFHFLLQGTFPTQGLNPCVLPFLQCRWSLHCWATGAAHRGLDPTLNISDVDSMAVK